MMEVSGLNSVPCTNICVCYYGVVPVAMEEHVSALFAADDRSEQSAFGIIYGINLWNLWDLGTPDWGI